MTEAIIENQNNIHTVDFQEGVEGKRKAVFVIFHAKGKPWENYREDDARRNLEIPTCLMIFRCDGRIGFVGGRVEEGQSLKEAAIREVEEEIGHKLELDLKPVAAHDIGSITTHAFSCEVSYDMIRHLQDDAVNAEDFGSEVVGVVLPHLTDYDRLDVKTKFGIVELLKCSMATSVREELIHFLLNEKIFSKKELRDIAQRAGYDLEELLK